MSDENPVLVGCSHGTRSAAGQQVMDELRAAIAQLRPGVQVVPANVDVHPPYLSDVMGPLSSAGTPAVVVPLLLSAGYHVSVDIAGAVARAPDLARAAQPLGPSPVLAQILDQRLTDAGAQMDDAIVLAAAGSSDPQSARAAEQVAQWLGQLRGGPVSLGYGSVALPSVPDAVTAARTSGRQVAIASYLLAPGHFADRLALAGADLVSAPLGAHPDLARLALQRYDEALAG